MTISILHWANESNLFDGLNTNENLNLKQTYYQYLSGSNLEFTENMNINVLRVTRLYIGRMCSVLKRGALRE